MNNSDDFPANLKRLRKAAGLSQDLLAGLAGLNKITISRFERGTQAPRRSNLRALAEILNCTVRDFYRNPQTGETKDIPEEISGEMPDETKYKIKLQVQNEHVKRQDDLIARYSEMIGLLEKKYYEAREANGGLAEEAKELREKIKRLTPDGQLAEIISLFARADDIAKAEIVRIAKRLLLDQEKGGTGFHGKSTLKPKGRRK